MDGPTFDDGEVAGFEGEDVDRIFEFGSSHLIRISSQSMSISNGGDRKWRSTSHPSHDHNRIKTWKGTFSVSLSLESTEHKIRTVKI